MTLGDLHRSFLRPTL